MRTLDQLVQLQFKAIEKALGGLLGGVKILNGRLDAHDKVLDELSKRVAKLEETK